MASISQSVAGRIIGISTSRANFRNARPGDGARKATFSYVRYKLMLPDDGPADVTPASHFHRHGGDRQPHPGRTRIKSDAARGQPAVARTGAHSRGSCARADHDG